MDNNLWLEMYNQAFNWINWGFPEHFDNKTLFVLFPAYIMLYHKGTHF